MPRIISRIIDQYDFEGPPVSGNALVYDSSTQKFKTLPVNSNATGILSIANGGTSSSTATGALAALGAIGSITSTNGSVSLASSGTNVDLSVTIAGSTNNVVVQVKNLTGSLLTKGTVVYINAATGQLPNVTKALATSDATSAQTLGMLSADLVNGGTGYVTIIGLIDDIDTSLYQDGDQLYLSGTTAGTFTNTKTYAPTHLVYVGVVQYAHQIHGKIFVKVQNGYELDELHNVVARYPTSGQTIVYNSASGLWLTAPLPLTAGVTGILPIANGGTNNSTLGTSGAVLYFDGSQVQGQSLLTYTPTGIAINSVTPSGALQIKTTSSSNKGLIVQGSASQTANLQEWISTSGLADMYVTSADNLGFAKAKSIFWGDGNNSIYYTTNNQFYSTSYDGYWRFSSVAHNSLANFDMRNGSASFYLTRSASGAGYPLTFTAGDGYTSGAGGNIILQAGLQATTGGDGKVIVKQRSGQTSNIFEVQATDGTAAISVSSANPSVVTISDRGGADIVVGANQIQINRNNASTVYFHNAAAAGQASVDIRSANLLCGGYSSGNIPLIVRSHASQTANLQEWRNGSGNAISYIDSSGKLYNNNLLALPTSSGAGNNINIIAGSGVSSGSGGSVILQAGVQATTGGDGTVAIRQASGQTSNLFETINSTGAKLFQISNNGQVASFTSDSSSSPGNRWTGTITFNPNLFGTDVPGFAFSNTHSSYGSRGGISANGVSLNAGTITASWNGPTASTMLNLNRNGSARYSIYDDVVTNNNIYFYTGTSTTTAIFQNQKTIAVRAPASASANIQEWQNASGTALSYINASGNLYNNNLLALPTSSGAGNNVNIIAGSGVSSGAGGSVILQAGVQATTGGDGKVVIRQASGQTSNLQEWQTPSGTLKASIQNGGGFLFPTTSSMIYNTLNLSVYGTYNGIIFEDIHQDGRTKMRHSATSSSSIDFWGGNVPIQLTSCASNNMFLGGNTWLGTSAAPGGAQATRVVADQATPQGRVYFYGHTYSSSTNHPILTNSYNGYEFYTAVNASWTGGQTGYPYGYKTLSASGHTWKFTSASGSVNPLCVQSVSGQTANLQEWQNASGTALSYIDSTGALSVNNIYSIPTASGAGNNLLISAASGVSSGAGGNIILKAGLQATTGGDGKVIIQQVSGQTSNLQEWQDNTGTRLLSVANAGGYPSIAGNAGTSIALGNYLDLNAGGLIRLNSPTYTTNYISVARLIPTATTTSVVVQGRASQTANLQEWQNTSAYVYGSVGPSGAISLFPYGTGLGNTNELRFVELAANGTDYVGFKAPNLISSPVIWTLPSGDGSTGQALVTNGSGLLSWATAGGGGGTGTVTSVSGTGSVNGLTLTGTVTSSGSLTLGGTLSNISLITAVSGVLPIANGGTNLSAIGSANQILGVNSGASALEYKTLTAGSGISISNAAGSITINSSGSTTNALTIGNGLTGGSFNGSSATTINVNSSGYSNTATGTVASYDLGTTSFVKANPSTSGLTINGFSSSGSYDGRNVKLVNVSNYNITIVNTGTTVCVGGTNIILGSKDAAELILDSGASVWRVF